MVKMPIKQCFTTYIVPIISGIGTIAAVYGVYKLYQYVKREDDYFVNISWHGGISQRRILVLGLNDAGKTRLLQCFKRSTTIPGDILPTPRPTIGHSLMSTSIAGIDYHFWDVSGNGRDYWHEFVYNIDVLLWVVDSSRPDKFEESKVALRQFVHTVDRHQDEEKDESIHVYGIPIVVVASKQDQSNSTSPNEILKTMDVEQFKSRHRVYVVGTHVPNVGCRQGMWRLYELVSFANKKRSQLQPARDGVPHL